MTNRSINNLLVVIIILCSTSFYNLQALGRVQKVVDLLGIGLILALLAIHVVYTKNEPIKHNFVLFITLIFVSFFTSLFMASYDRDQSISATLFAQRALFFYLFYYLLHQLRMRPRDLELIIIFFGILHAALFLLQYMVYPKLLFNAFIFVGRGTIRIYLAGSDYLVICFFMSLMAFLKTSKPRYMFFTLLSFSIFVLLGGRQTMALMVLVMVLAVFFSRKVKSRFGISILIAAGAFAVFLLFQPIFQQMILESKSNAVEGRSYVRIKAAQYFLTDFYKSSIAYLTGNGASYPESSFGHEIEYLKISRGIYLGDIGILGSYVVYGLFFIIGVMGIIFRTLRTKYEDKYLYIKYIFIGFLLSLITGSGFSNADFICSLCILLYIVDVSNHLYTKGLTAADQPTDNRFLN